MSATASAASIDRDIEVEALCESLATLRVCEASALETMRRSLIHNGQLSALMAFAQHDTLEVIDGFKRLRAARALGWPRVRVRLLAVDPIEAKLCLAAQHEGRHLTELEEGWLVRSLHREHGLYQATIAARLGRHPAWVSRRLMLVERLDGAVQGDVRLGLLAPRAAVEIGQLPRGNQAAASTMTVRRGLTVRQLALVVGELLECADETERAARIVALTEGAPHKPRSSPRPLRKTVAECDRIAADITTLRQVAGRLQACLHQAPLSVLGTEVSDVLTEGLRGLLPVVTALAHTIESVMAQSGYAA